MSEVFRTEVCKGYDPKAVLAALLEAGCLAPDKGEAYRCKPRIAGIGTAWGYLILDKILTLDI
jgi:putative DNA primase/helicase